MTRCLGFLLTAAVLWMAVRLSLVFLYEPLTVGWVSIALALMVAAYFMARSSSYVLNVVAVPMLYTGITIGLGLILGMTREYGGWIIVSALAATVLSLIVLGVRMALPGRVEKADLITMIVSGAFVGSIFSAYLVERFDFYPRGGAVSLWSFAVIWASVSLLTWALSMRLVGNERFALSEAVLGPVLVLRPKT